MCNRPSSDSLKISQVIQHKPNSVLNNLKLNINGCVKYSTWLLESRQSDTERNSNLRQNESYLLAAVCEHKLLPSSACSRSGRHVFTESRPHSLRAVIGWRLHTLCPKADPETRPDLQRLCRYRHQHTLLWVMSVHVVFRKIQLVLPWVCSWSAFKWKRVEGSPIQRKVSAVLSEVN